MKIDKELFYTVEDYFDIALHKDLDAAKEYRYDCGLRFTESETKKVIRCLKIKQTVLISVCLAMIIFIIFFLDWMIDTYSPIGHRYSLSSRRALRNLLCAVVGLIITYVNNKLFYWLAVRRLCKLHVKRSAFVVLR